MEGTEEMSSSDRDAEAARFIDEVIELNVQYGADDRVPKTKYNDAVRQASAAFAGLRPT
jgi:hypothetical protein